MTDERPSFDLSVVEQFRRSRFEPLRDLALAMDAQDWGRREQA